LPILIGVIKRKITEHGASVALNNYPGNYLNVGYPDANKGRGYGKLDGDAKNTPISADGFPYDIHEPNELEGDEFSDPLLQNKFTGKMGAYAPSKPDYVSRPGDPFSFFDDATVGLAENLIKEYVKLFLESGMTLRPGSSGTDGAVTQWGTRIPGGTQFGWSSAHRLPQRQDQYEPVFSLRDLMTKREDYTDRTQGELEPEPDEEWKKEYGKEQREKIYPFFWE